jgi:hypothetical protein
VPTGVGFPFPQPEKEATMRRFMVLFVVLGLVMVLGLEPSMAQKMEQKKVEASGKIEATYTKQEPIEIGDTSGHIMTLATSEGTNSSTGEQEFLDGAQTVNMSFADLVGGNGPQQGYINFVKEGDGIFAKWEGIVTTTKSPEGTPKTSFEGTFSYTGGIGQFEHIQGSGTYEGHYTSQKSYVVEWKAMYIISK